MDADYTNGEITNGHLDHGNISNGNVFENSTICFATVHKETDSGELPPPSENELYGPPSREFTLKIDEETENVDENASDSPANTEDDHEPIPDYGLQANIENHENNHEPANVIAGNDETFATTEQIENPANQETNLSSKTVDDENNDSCVQEEVVQSNESYQERTHLDDETENYKEENIINVKGQDESNEATTEAEDKKQSSREGTSNDNLVKVDN